jgi:hypothetical protein
MTQLDGGDVRSDPASEDEGPLPIEAKRIKSFASFFKNYMSVSTIVVAAAPIPIGSLHLIPTYQAQRGLITTLSSLLAFLLLGFVFFQRVWLGRKWFPSSEEFQPSHISWYPVASIIASVASIFVYMLLLLNGDQIVTEATLAKAPLSSIHNGIWLVFLQVGFFVFAELAFIIMALREYLQDLLGISDSQLIRIKPNDTTSAASRI